jgi:hypothetical protein
MLDTHEEWIDEVHLHDMIEALQSSNDMSCPTGRPTSIWDACHGRPFNLLHSSGNISQAARQLASAGYHSSKGLEPRFNKLFFCWR